MALADLEGFYRDAKKHYDEDEAFAERARNYVVKLQSGDTYFREMWRKLVDITMTQNQITYDRLNVTLTRDDVMGESLYNPMLPGIVADLKAKGLAVESEGATVVFLDEFKNKEGDPMGVIIQKKDGGYLYTTTDIACAKYRYETLHADRVLYYIDSRQHQHLMQARTIVRKAGYVPDSVPLEHHMFGMMLGKDGKPFKTRAGGTVKLADLLDEALERARRLVAEKNPDMPADELEKLANAVGIGAVKYADLSKTAPLTISSTGIICWLSKAIPHLICSMPIRVCCLFSVKRTSTSRRWRARRLSLAKIAKRSLLPVCCSLKKP